MDQLACDKKTQYVHTLTQWNFWFWLSLVSPCIRNSHIFIPSWWISHMNFVISELLSKHYQYRSIVIDRDNHIIGIGKNKVCKNKIFRNSTKNSLHEPNHSLNTPNKLLGHSVLFYWCEWAEFSNKATLKIRFSIRFHGCPIRA